MFLSLSTGAFVHVTTPGNSLIRYSATSNFPKLKVTLQWCEQSLISLLGLCLQSLIKYMITIGEPCFTATCRAVFPSLSTSASVHVTKPGNSLIRYSAACRFSLPIATLCGICLCFSVWISYPFSITHFTIFM